jgi:hypothetical protein
MQSSEKHIFYCTANFPFHSRSRPLGTASLISYLDVSLDVCHQPAESGDIISNIFYVLLLHNSGSHFTSLSLVNVIGGKWLNILSSLSLFRCCANWKILKSNGTLSTHSRSFFPPVTFSKPKNQRERGEKRRVRKNIWNSPNESEWYQLIYGLYSSLHRVRFRSLLSCITERSEFNSRSATAISLHFISLPFEFMELRMISFFSAARCLLSIVSRSLEGHWRN